MNFGEWIGVSTRSSVDISQFSFFVRFSGSRMQTLEKPSDLALQKPCLKLMP